MKVLFRAERGMEQERNLRSSVQQELSYGELGGERTMQRHLLSFLQVKPCSSKLRFCAALWPRRQGGKEWLRAIR